MSCLCVWRVPNLILIVTPLSYVSCLCVSRVPNLILIVTPLTHCRVVSMCLTCSQPDHDRDTIYPLSCHVCVSYVPPTSSWSWHHWPTVVSMCLTCPQPDPDRDRPLTHCCVVSVFLACSQPDPDRNQRRGLQEADCARSLQHPPPSAPVPRGLPGPHLLRQGLLRVAGAHLAPDQPHEEDRQDFSQPQTRFEVDLWPRTWPATRGRASRLLSTSNPVWGRSPTSHQTSHMRKIVKTSVNLNPCLR